MLKYSLDMVYGPLQKLDTLGISFWFSNTVSKLNKEHFLKFSKAAWFLIYLCLTYKVQVKYWLRSGTFVIMFALN